MANCLTTRFIKLCYTSKFYVIVCSIKDVLEVLTVVNTPGVLGALLGSVIFKLGSSATYSFNSMLIGSSSKAEMVV